MVFNKSETSRKEITSFSGFFTINFGKLTPPLLHIVVQFDTLKYIQYSILYLISIFEYI